MAHFISFRLICFQRLPPLYEEWHEQERKFPQHDLKLPPPEGRVAKYLFMADHAHNCGWGNVLQEMILNAHIAYVLKRSFVFYNYTWDRTSSDYSTFNGNKIIPSRIPVSAMLSGPIIGGSFPENDSFSVPRAVSHEYYQTVCPDSEKHVINTEEVKPKILNVSGWYDGDRLFNEWVTFMRGEEVREEKCVEFQDSKGQLFDIWLFGDDGVLTLWPSLRESPILTEFGFSPMILSAYLSNRHLFVNKNTYQTEDPGDNLAIARTKPIPGLLTLHIRRGDFSDHCLHLARWSSKFTGFNTFPEFKDRFHPPESEEERAVEYGKRCYPSIEQIVKKVREVATDAHDHALSSEITVSPLKRIYVMTNAPKAWLKDLKRALMDDAVVPWEAIQTSRDLGLTWEQKYVAQAVDMYVGVRSQVFVGNGFSSLTGNIMMLRMAHGVDPSINSRLW
ncbi:hypothetical protein VKT23_015870 [Stygiomarasmius scandens]|uniref:Fucosyltransferase n=1 Tax=Marasmiellus scandens TaxID=2682957 RepID=A0ABR1J047_9AGAR